MQNAMNPPHRISVTLLSAAACALLSCCSGADAKREKAAPALAAARVNQPSASLLDRLAQAVIAGDLRGIDGDPARAGALQFADDFDAAPTLPWFDGEWLDAIAADAELPHHARADLLSIEGGHGISIAADSGGLHAVIPAVADECYLVHARMRAPVGSRGAELVFASLSAAAPDAAGLASMLRSVPKTEIAARRGSLLASESLGGWQELSLFVPPREGRQSLSLSLLPSNAGVEVDRIEVRRLTRPARVHFTPRLAGDAASHPLRRVLDVGDATVDALLVPPQVSVAFEVTIPAQRARLRFLPAALGSGRGESVELVVRADGKEIWRGRKEAAPLDEPATLAPIEVDLARLAGRSVVVEFATAAAAADVVGCFGVPELLGAREAPRRKNLLLISLDTTRADLLGCYGDTRGLTRHLDAFAAQGTRFEDVVSPSSWTLPTHMSLMSGQHPILHGMIAAPRLIDPIRSRLIGARLREMGYSTAAFTGGGPMVPRNGFGLGFDYYSVNDPCGLTKYDHGKPEVRAARASEADTLAPTLEWLRAHHEQPFFLFVHTFFVHNYYPHPEYLARLDDPNAAVANDQPLILGDLAMAGDDAALARLRKLYAAALLETDATLIPRLLDELSALHLDDDTIVCILADHGEEHLEHGQFGHRLELFGESTRVPWLLRGPGVPAGLVRPDRVDLADVSPTLAALLDLPPEPLDFARDQFAPDAGSDAQERAHLLLFGPVGQPKSREALVVGPWKLMRWRGVGEESEVRLYRIDTDPGETQDVAQEDPARLRALTAQLDARIAELTEQAADLPGSNVQTRELGAVELERLRGLGYADH